MPIEIRELHIRMNVTAGPVARGGAGHTEAGAGQDGDAKRAADDELVARCVEQVMELLRNRAER